ncbi:MAG: restriction endonuclease [Lachnospiraceae bacterium]|nr:restriction endonuclease [Lachnospiraceae bacterium]
MIKKIIEYLVLVIITTCVITAYGYFYIINRDAVDLRELCLTCFLISSVLVFAINRLLKYMGDVRYLHSPLSKIDKMEGEEFEYYLKLKLMKFGYKVEMTPTSGDYGADLFCFNKDETIVVQAKRYEANVGTKAVQEVVGAMEYYEADSAVVITNSYFTINALNLAEANKVALIDRDKLLSFKKEDLYYSE